MPLSSSSPRDLSPDQLDVLGELINIGVGRAAASLSELIGSRIELHVPSVRLCSAAERHDWTESVSQADSTLIVQEFRGSVNGQAGLLFDQQSSMVLAQVLSGLPEAPQILDSEMTSILLEVGNIVLNAVLGSLANQMHAALTYSIPSVLLGRDLCASQSVLSSPDRAEDLLLADVDFNAAEYSIRGAIVIAFALGAVEDLLMSAGGNLNSKP